MHLETLTWSSPRSLPSVPSTSMTMTFMSFPLHIQIPIFSLEYAVVKGWKLLTFRRLLSSRFVHDIEGSAEQSVEQGTFPD